MPSSAAMKRSKPRAQLGAGFAQRRDRLRRLLDLIAARAALPEKFAQVLEPNIERSAVIAAGDLGQRPVDVGLVAVKLGKKLLDLAPGIKHRSEPILKFLLLLAKRGDARFQAVHLVAALLDLSEALRFAEALLQGRDGVFGIGAREVLSRPPRRWPALS